MSTRRIKAMGPWVLIQVLRPKDNWSLETIGSGIYIDEGPSNLGKIGFSRGLVHSVGRGKEDEKGRITPPDFKRGDVVVYRGYVEGAHKPAPLDDPDFCFIHMDSLELEVLDPGEGGLYEVPELDP